MISVFSPYITRRDMDLVLSRMVEDAVTEAVFNERFERTVKEQCLDIFIKIYFFVKAESIKF